MCNLMLQLQLLLAALSAFLPLVPDDYRGRAGEILNVAAQAHSAGGAIAANVDDLAASLPPYAPMLKPWPPAAPW